MTSYWPTQLLQLGLVLGAAFRVYHNLGFLRLVRSGGHMEVA